MTSTHWLIVSLLWCSCVTVAIEKTIHAKLHAVTATIPSGEVEDKLHLQLTTRILSQRYCRADEDLDGLHLELKLHYTNTGHQRLILYKGSNLVSRLVISRNFQDLTLQQLEVNASLIQVIDGTMKIEEAVPGPLFVILPPGASYETETSVVLFVTRAEKSDIPGAVAPGEHVLQIEVPTWPKSNELAERLRDLWQQRGYLQSDPILSVPLPFTVGEGRVVKECS